MDVEYEISSGRYTKNGEFVWDLPLARGSDNRPLGTTANLHGRLRKAQRNGDSDPNREFVTDVETLLSNLPLNDRLRKEAAGEILLTYRKCKKLFDCKDTILSRAAAVTYYYFRTLKLSPSYARIEFSMGEIADAGAVDLKDLRSSFRVLLSKKSKLMRPPPSDVRAFIDRYINALGLPADKRARLIEEVRRDLVLFCDRMMLKTDTGTEGAAPSVIVVRTSGGDEVSAPSIIAVRSPGQVEITVPTRSVECDTYAAGAIYHACRTVGIPLSRSELSDITKVPPSTIEKQHLWMTEYKKRADAQENNAFN